MNRFENMETFIRVVEAGSISGAADRMGIAKSAVSRRLKELEGHLGVELFHRTTRRMNLTETGRAYYHQAVRILDDVLEAEIATSQAHTELQGVLKVALPLTFGMMHLGPAINDFLLAHPNIEFDLDFNDREVDLIQEGFDLAIRIAKLSDSSLIARRLFSVNMIMVASSAYLDRMGTPTTPQDLAEHQCLAYSVTHDFETWHFVDKNKKPIAVRIKPYIKASNGSFLRDAAIKGFGITSQPSFINYKEIQSGLLQPILTDYTHSELNAYAVYPQTRHLSQRVRTFVDFLVKRFEGTPYWDE